MNVGGTILWSGLTVGAFAAARALFLRTRFPLFHPSALGLGFIVLLVNLSGHPYPEYQQGTAWLSWLLGPAVVAMAVPVYRLRGLIWRQRTALGITVSVGLVFAFGSMAALLWILRLPKEIVEAGTLKSITSPVAYAIAREAGIRTEPVIVGVLIAGMFGSTFGPLILKHLLGVNDPRALGLALGCGSHGIGVARALELGEQCGAFASIGMSGTTMLGALAFPYLLHWIYG